MTPTTAGQQPYYDPYDYDIDANAQDVWRQLRDEAPLYYNAEHDFYALSRYDDVLTAITDAAAFSSAHGIVLEMISDAIFPMPLMIMRDPPEHTRLRALASRAFTPRAIANLEVRVRDVCAELLDPFVGTGSFDYVHDFAALLPPTVILALLGFPPGFEREWQEEVDASFDLGETEARPQLIAEGGVVSGVLAEPLMALVEQRRAHAEEDLVSALVYGDLEGDDGKRRPLTPDEINAYVLMVAHAGTETVARLLSWSAVLLSRHPEQQRRLREDHARISNGIEEILRYEAPSPVQGRWVARDEDWHGQVVPSGSKMLLLNGSANRDERHFPEPDTFDVTRTIDRHLSFGYGTHFCIGAALARLEGRVALEMTFDRFPEWRVDESALQWVHTSSVRGFASAPLVFG
jgi:cytochrome P450